MSAEAPSRPADGLLRLVELEAAAAGAAAPRLTDDAVAAALRRAADLLAAHKDAVLAANAADVAGAEDDLDAGALDRLTLDDRRIAGLGEQLLALAELPPLEREIERWTLDNGLAVSARRIPIGVVGANFEARPGVALDVAGQLLKSLNACILRTGSAALATVTTLVDEVLRPALADAGAPPEAVGLVREASRDGAVALVSLPHAIPLVILRGSGETTRRLARVAALEGVRVLAHAEGGGVLYVDAAAGPEMTLRLIEASVDRLGVCNRLNLLLVHRDALGRLEPALGLLAKLGLSAYGTARAREQAPALLPLDVPLGHEWANDPLRVASVTVDVVASLAEAVQIANTQVSGLAAAVVTDSAASAEAFLASYRGTAAFWNAPTRFTDGFALTGAPETGINVDVAPGPRGPVTYRDLWLRQLRVTGDGTQRR
ncbi:MAG: aldehyde dehydrogenase family protein [Gaiellaceae bacterium]